MDNKQISQIRVLLVDDQTLFRQSLAYLLDQNPDILLVGEAADGVQAVDRARELRPDVVLMDIRMPQRTGLEAARIIAEELPGVHVLMLSGSEVGANLLEALRAGARGYMPKNVDSAKLLEAIRLVSEGDIVISSLVADSLLAMLGAVPDAVMLQLRSPGEALTSRELEILSHLAHGGSNRDIGLSLGISENTVRAHLRNILDKLGLRSRVQAAAYAIREGLVADVSEADAQ